MRLLLVAATLGLVHLSALGRFPDAHDLPPRAWPGPVFKLSQDYPKSLPPAEAEPWKAFDPTAQPAQYVSALYRYVLEGNVDSEWSGSDNAVRRWYHAPWMHFGPSGREFVRGLTRERTTPRARPGQPGELGPNQRSCFQNWAVSLFNSRGGYTLGRVWDDPMVPNIADGVFADGTVVVKLLFTAATVEEVPYLGGALEWEADIHEIPADDLDCRREDRRKVQKVRLLQMDLAVKDTRVKPTGWVFATMSYDGRLPGSAWHERMVAVGSQWGNDPDLPDGGKPQESWINTAIATPQHLGYQGRLNGPVDNPRSSCLSCHSTAQVPALSPMTFPQPATPEQIKRWFRNLAGEEAFDRRAISADYSLQLAMGIQNFQTWLANMGGSFATTRLVVPAAAAITTLSQPLGNEALPTPPSAAPRVRIGKETVFRITRE